MVGQYPHKLVYTTLAGGEYNDDTGEYDPVVPTEITVPCRARPNGAGREIKARDGVSQVYSYDLGFPKGTGKIPENTNVTILGIDDEVLYEGVLIQFQEGVWSVRAWV